MRHALLLAVFLTAHGSAALAEQSAPADPPLTAPRRGELRSLMEGWRAAKIESSAMVNEFLKTQDEPYARNIRAELFYLTYEMEARTEAVIKKLKDEVAAAGGPDAAARARALDDMFKLRMAYFFNSMLVDIINDYDDKDDDSARRPKISKHELKTLSDETVKATGFPAASFHVEIKLRP